jgi:TPR repeat protein
MFFAKRRRSGGGLLGFILILAVLYFTGVLPDLWARAKNTAGQCSSVLARSGVPGGQIICQGVAGAVNAVDRAALVVESQIRACVNTRRLPFSWGQMGNMLPAPVQEIAALLEKSAYGAYWSNAGILSSEKTLQYLIELGPNRAGTFYNSNAPLQGAMDRFTLGQRLMDSSPSQGMAWMRQGAAFGEYGLLPQLSLGNTYMSGKGGIPADPMQALAYYQQAGQSLVMLRTSKDPDARQLLGALGVSPDALQAEIIAAIALIQRR